MEITVKYTRKEAQQIIADAHSKNYPLPEGKKWNCTIETYGDVKLYALDEKETEKSE